MPIIVLQHAAHNTPGRLGHCLRDNGFVLDIRRLDLPANHAYHAGRVQGVPKDLDNVHGVVTLGGPMNVGDDVAWMQEELAFLKKAHEAQLPIVGLCLGHQMLAAALGGQVGPMDKPEVGFHNVSISPMGQTDTILSGIPWTSPQYQSHGQEVKQLPPGAMGLAGSKGCKVQIFKAGLRSYGFQFHFECDQTGIAELERCDPGMSDWAHKSDAPKGADAAGSMEMFSRAADRLCVNLATYLFRTKAKVGV